MAKYNSGYVTARKVTGAGVIKTSAGAIRTHEGGIGFKRSDKSELFLAGVSTFVEDTFYESADARMTRIRGLVAKVVVEDVEWVKNFVFWLRHTANMRSVSLAIALDAAKVLNDKKLAGGRQIVAAAMDRADEPGEAIAYWQTNYGRKMPQSVKRGIADAATKLYTSDAVFKYDAEGKSIRFADVIQLVHPSPKDDRQSTVFKFALDRRYNSKVEAPFARKATWENISSDGPMTAEKWESAIPTMGYMALLRNLRNFIEAGVSRKVMNAVAKRISDPAQVAKSKQLPFRFWSAYNAVGNNNVFKLAIDDGLNAAASNVPALKGKTLVLVDVSGSMGWGRFSEKGSMANIDAATLFAGVLGARADEADIVWFGSRSGKVDYSKTDSPLEIMKAIYREGGGTDLARAVRDWYKAGYDRVVVITDEQHNGGAVFSPVPSNVPIFVWNLGGYRPAASSQSNVFVQGGLSDASFGYISLIESGVNESWPWE